MPTKTLPSNPSLDHLKHQAKDLLNPSPDQEAGVCQRIREFHPRFHSATDQEITSAKFSLSDAQLTIAREYGFASWARLRSHVASKNAASTTKEGRISIEDPEFRRAVELLDSGDVAGLRELLVQHPGLVHRRLSFEGVNYFRNPSLLEFVAENPIRNGNLPANIVEVARIILEAGAKESLEAINSTLELVSSGRIPRECNVQEPLINLLCDYGADPNAAIKAAVGHGESSAVSLLLKRGAQMTMAVAAALGDVSQVKAMFPRSSEGERHLALAWSAQFGHDQVVRVLLGNGVDPNRYNPMGAHSHSTPLHQAAFNGHLAVVELLVNKGAKLDLRDLIYKGTPLEWAEHGGQMKIVEFLKKTGD